MSGEFCSRADWETGGFPPYTLGAPNRTQSLLGEKAGGYDFSNFLVGNRLQKVPASLEAAFMSVRFWTPTAF